MPGSGMAQQKDFVKKHPQAVEVTLSGDGIGLTSKPS
jgi:hypothetical protein